ncbi:hypothetical protein ACJX0J_012682, partial [Zea mays]
AMFALIFSSMFQIELLRNSGLFLSKALRNKENLEGKRWPNYLRLLMQAITLRARWPHTTLLGRLFFAFALEQGLDNNVFSLSFLLHNSEMIFFWYNYYDF